MAVTKQSTRKRASTKKSTPKKTAKKRTSHKRSVRSVKVQSLPHEAFWINNGPVITSLSELHDALKALTDEQYHYHADKSHNDFAAWIAAVMDNPDCAKKMTKAHTRTKAIKVLEAYL